MKVLRCFTILVLSCLLVPGAASAQESECENSCAPCPSDPFDWKNLGYGVSSYMTWMEPDEGCLGPYGCVPWSECRPPDTEEDLDPPEVLEADIDRLLALDRKSVSEWILSNRKDFNLEVVEGTLQVNNRCGGLITWVALEPSQAASVRALLDQD